jgi:hypothetical protein
MTTDDLRERRRKLLEGFSWWSTWKSLADDAITALTERDDRIAELETEVKEYEFLFSLQNECLHDATAAWREATGQFNMSPDLGVLLEWLLGYKESAERPAEALDFIDSIPPPNLVTVEGKSEHWWYRLVKDMWDQATEALAAYRDRVSPSEHSSSQEPTIRDTVLQGKDTHSACKKDNE